MSTRRDFLKDVGLATAGVTLNPGSVFAMTSKEAKKAKGDKVKIAYIGIGNRGQQNIDEFARTNMVEVVALCDVDLQGKQCQKALKMYPNAKRFTDFRKLFDEYSEHFDAVAVSVPDHTHFVVCMAAMKHGKHVYCEKPLIRTFQEGEILIEMANRHPEIVTQVGNQGHSEANYFQFKAWKEAGIIKNVRAVTAQMNNSRRWHGWDCNLQSFFPEEPVPATLDWDSWLCGEMYHKYNKDYVNGQWRCWYDFGMGALGDWGAHLIDTVHEFLELGLPTEINMLRAEGHNPFFYPYSSTIEFKFPARGDMPPVDITWYDGLDNIPPVPEGYGNVELDPNIPTVAGGKIQPAKLNPGKIIYSDELTFKGGSHGSTLSIIPESKAKEWESKLPEVPQSPSDHFANFLLSCQGVEKPRSPFSVAGPLSQVFCLGVIAQQLNARLKFDPETKQFINSPVANLLLRRGIPRKGWEEFYQL